MKHHAMIYGLATTFVFGSAVLGIAQASPPGEHHHHKHHVSKHHGKAGSCGENMYWGAKVHHCVDAREKSKGNWIPF